nr:activating signal cointegrator 1 complex subunit 2-like [Lytechinus pictus]
MGKDDPIPLENRTVSVTNRDGSKMNHPALDEYWLEQVNFVKYKPPPDPHDGAGLEEWEERLHFMEEDLQWLLKLPHHQFWSQVINDVSLQQSLESYLQDAPRSHDPSKAKIPATLASLHNSVHRLVFMAFLRMSTHKETKDHFITPHVFGDLIYNHFVFDIAKLMDLCIIYGGGNSALLSKMLENIFSHQPQYQNDLEVVVDTTLTVLSKILEKCGFHGSNVPQLIAEAGRQPISNQDLYDVIMYMADSAQTLLAFLQVYPAVCQVFYRKKAIQRIASFYEILMPELLDFIQERDWEDESVKDTLKKHLVIAQSGLVHTCVLILNTCCVQPILSKSGSDEVCSHIESYIELLTSLLTDKLFLAAICDHSNIQDDIDIMLQTSHQLDETRTQFIVDGMKEALALYGCKKTEDTSEDVTPKGNQSLDVIVAAPEDYQTDSYLEDKVFSACATPAAKTGVELDSLISGVRDLLPDLGEGFIMACLEEYNYDSARVINDILEDKLLESLKCLDRNMKRTKPKAAPAEDLLSQRANVFDNDEFDVFTKDKVDMSKIQKGKRKEDSAHSILSDKSTIQELKKSYEQYYEVSYEYDDEYDDTYDTINVGADDADDADELQTRRPFTMPRVLAAAQTRSSEEEENEEEEERDGERFKDSRTLEGWRAGSGREHSQPELKGQPSRGGRGRGGQGRGGGGGRGRGGGRTDQELKTRQKNERHKGQRANHNRKAMADKKRSKGMGPLPN